MITKFNRFGQYNVVPRSFNLHSFLEASALRRALFSDPWKKLARSQMALVIYPMRT